MTPDPAQVAAQITGCREHDYLPGWCAVHRFVGYGVESGRWPCLEHERATEVVRAALEQAWGQGVEDEAEHRAAPNPYREGGR